MKTYIAVFMALAVAISGCIEADRAADPEERVILLASQSRQDKLKALMDAHRASIYSQYPRDVKDLTNPGVLTKFLLTENMNPSFDFVNDFLPDGRPKVVHPIGSLASVKFVWTEDVKYKYSGLFTGADSCLARLSVATKPTDSNIVPGIAVKCLRDGAETPSGNIIAMYSLEGQGKNFNFFANEFSNVVKRPVSIGLKIVEKKFRTASSCATWLSTAQFASIKQDGSNYLKYGGSLDGSDVTRPIILYFVPSGEVSFPESSGRDFRDDLKTIPVGTTLYKIYGLYLSSPFGGDREYLGDMITTSEFAASDFSDNKLFFQHDRGEKDGDCTIPE